MPDAKDNAKQSGDVHPPEVETDSGRRPRGTPEVPGAQGTGPAADDGNEKRGDQAVTQGGTLKDKDAAGTRRDEGKR